jgi:hypothetical protein
MKRLIFLITVIIFVLAVSCRKPQDYEDEAVISLGEISDTQSDADSSEPQIQLAQLPKPEGIPILVGIDKSIWVKDPTDPTPLLRMVNLYTNLYLRDSYSFGEYYFDTLYQTWVMTSPDFQGVILNWSNTSDSFKLIFKVERYQEFSQYLHVLNGGIDFVKNSTDTLYSSTFDLNTETSTLNLVYSILDVLTANVSAVRSAKFTPFNGVINGVVVGRNGKSTLIVDTVKSDDTRRVSVRFVRLGIVFDIRANVSAASAATNAPRYRDISGDFYANGARIGNVSGRKYEYDTPEHKSFLQIELNSGRIIRIW